MAKLRKPFYRVEEVAARWGMSADDIAAFALSNELTVSVAVAGVTVAFGDFEQYDVERWSRIPNGHRKLVGLADLHPGDAWHAFYSEPQHVRFFRTDEASYLEVEDVECPDGFPVRRQALVVRREELDRFEHEHQMEHGSVGTSTAVSPRGAQPRYDWDAFWVEVCRTAFTDGLPATQADFVRSMRDWFDASGQSPDESTIKKKLSPLWRVLRSGNQRWPRKFGR